MHYLLTPLQNHYDRGFGAVANSFKHAGDLIASPESESPSLDAHLPASFLYRHAVELYLKSGIIIFHRKFELPWEKESADSEPKVPVGGKWRLMYTIHALSPLYERLTTLFTAHASYLDAHTRTRWDLPSEFPEWIAKIDATDSSSTFFRYPVTKQHADRDGEKSPVKEDSVGNIFARMGPDHPPQKAFVVLNQNEEIVQAFHRDDSQTTAALEVLREASDCLYGLHAALRGELTGGW